MEADWEIEIGGDAPVIDAGWAGLVDLRNHPEASFEVAETTQLDGLKEALRSLNSQSSPVWTSKCDVWEVAEFDPYEMDAMPDEAKMAMACYLDLLPSGDQIWNSPETAISKSKDWCSKLAAVGLKNCRADFVIRRALLPGIARSVGVTVYLHACGQTRAKAHGVLSEALAAFVNAVPRS